MLDPISDTPLVLAYVFMSLLVLILCFILVNVIHKLYRSINSVESISTATPSQLKTSIMELDVDAMKTG
ncbi:uncharacterized protein [Drosophila tropicalis]|uniref:Uncharacterized protein n=1 Tax=Drosophila willistoni TaxID=7260 RepID=B4N3W5_DROWI|nr:uncharacterized protein LOC6645670 [Drosophila willistoni]EDW79320.1 uncharacterized protein Dwil_GK19128 [Drosophila willistoni]